GVGRAMLEYLCDYLKNEVGERYISVTASPYGLEFYKKMGFMQIKPQEMSYGMPVVSMEKVF
ncbi:MAG: GNAT family N-acetyltransferase, partial [Lachnospiraceae bacterium]|nr:GNAT family N-acetyltransferase [Lachnospiraceae bacterium]